MTDAYWIERCSLNGRQPTADVQDVVKTLPRALFAIATLAAAAAVAVVPTASSGPAAPVQVLAPWRSPYVERDTPPAVRERNERVQRELYAEAQKALHQPMTKANGCVPSEDGSFLPPHPNVVARVLGHHVEVLFRFSTFPDALACRPWFASVVVYSKGGGSFSNWVERYRLDGPQGRVALILPFNGRPPYHLIVQAENIVGRRAKQVEQVLRCPGTSHRTNGCLRGIHPTLHGPLTPKPVLPLRGITRATLEASFQQVIADERRPPITGSIPKGARCPSLRACVVTYLEPVFPRSPYRVRYQVAGQQLAGCWIAYGGRALDDLPYDDAGHGRSFLAGCGSWLQ